MQPCPTPKVCSQGLALKLSAPLYPLGAGQAAKECAWAQPVSPQTLHTPPHGWVHKYTPRLQARGLSELLSRAAIMECLQGSRGVLLSSLRPRLNQGSTPGREGEAPICDHHLPGQ